MKILLMLVVGMFMIVGAISIALADKQTDTDGDKWWDDIDNCPNDFNYLQSDVDGDGDGDICDSCPDNSGNACDPAYSNSTYIEHPFAGDFIINNTAVDASADWKAELILKDTTITKNTTITITREDSTDTGNPANFAVCSGFTGCDSSGTGEYDFSIVSSDMETFDDTYTMRISYDLASWFECEWGIGICDIYYCDPGNVKPLCWTPLWADCATEPGWCYIDDTTAAPINHMQGYPYADIMPKTEFILPLNYTYTSPVSVNIRAMPNENATKGITKRWYFNGTGNTTYAAATTVTLAAGNYYNFSAYANDSLGNTTQYDVQFNVTEAPAGSTCIPPSSGNWAINCAENCTWFYSQSIPGNISITGTGRMHLYGWWVFKSKGAYVYIDDGCQLNIKSTGGFRA